MWAIEATKKSQQLITLSGFLELSATPILMDHLASAHRKQPHGDIYTYRHTLTYID